MIRIKLKTGSMTISTQERDKLVKMGVIYSNLVTGREIHKLVKMAVT